MRWLGMHLLVQPAKKRLLIPAPHVIEAAHSVHDAPLEQRMNAFIIKKREKEKDTRDEAQGVFFQAKVYLRKQVNGERATRMPYTIKVSKCIQGWCVIVEHRGLTFVHSSVQGSFSSVWSVMYGVAAGSI